MIDYIEKGDAPINVVITKYSYSQLDALGRDQLIKFDRVDALYMGGCACCDKKRHYSKRSGAISNTT